MATNLWLDGPRSTWVDLISLDTGDLLQTWDFGVSEATTVEFVPGADTLAVGTSDGESNSGRSGADLGPFARPAVEPRGVATRAMGWGRRQGRPLRYEACS